MHVCVGASMHLIVSMKFVIVWVSFNARHVFLPSKLQLTPLDVHSQITDDKLAFIFLPVLTNGKIK